MVIRLLHDNCYETHQWCSFPVEVKALQISERVFEVESDELKRVGFVNGSEKSLHFLLTPGWVELVE